MKRYFKLLSCALMFIAPSLSAQMSSEHVRERGETVDIEEQLAQTITAAEMKRHLTTLASREFEGRETGTSGQKKAAEYIAGYFQMLKLPSYWERKGLFSENKFLC